MKPRQRFQFRWRHPTLFLWALFGLISGASAQASSAILVYPVNPEGVLIGSIQYISPDAVRILDGSSVIGYSNQYTYNHPIYLTAGEHHIWVQFNGITIGRSVSLQDGETLPLTFVFERTEFPLRQWLDSLQLNFKREISRSFSLSRDWPSDGWLEPYDGLWEGVLYGSVFTETQGLETIGVSAFQSFSYALTGHSYDISMSGSFSTSSTQNTWGSMSWTADLPVPKFEANIPGGSFESWHVQYKRHGFYPYMSFSQTAVEPRLFVGDFPGYDNLSLIPAAQPYQYIHFPSITNALGGSSFIGFGPETSANVSRSVSESGTIDYLKMASIPYDMTMEGIRAGTFEVSLPCRSSQAGFEVRTEFEITLGSDAMGCPQASAKYTHSWNAVPGAAYYTLNNVSVGNSTRVVGPAVAGALEPGRAGCPLREPLYRQLDERIPLDLTVTAYGSTGNPLLKFECERKRMRICPPPVGIPLTADMDDDGVGDWLLDSSEEGDDLWCSGATHEMLVLYEHGTLCAMCFFPHGRNAYGRIGPRHIWYNWEDNDCDRDGLVDVIVYEYDGVTFKLIHKQGSGDENGDGKVSIADIMQYPEDDESVLPPPRDRAELHSWVLDAIIRTGGNPLLDQSLDDDGDPECVFEGRIPEGTDFYTLPPCRLLDTRSQYGPFGGPALASGAVRPFLIAGQCGVPHTARAVALNVTALNASNGGHLTLFGEGAPPLSSTINFVDGAARANSAIVGLSTNGVLSVKPFVAGGGQVDIVIDVAGYLFTALR